MTGFRSSTAMRADAWHPKVLLYGPTHGGKSDALLTFPGVAVVDAENRIEEFVDRPERFGEFAGAAV